MKILNLYAGIGGNRKLWDGDIEVTAVELNPDIAKIYQDFFPDDKVIVADAHKYLLDHFEEYDFIWSSPPCPSHSRVRKANLKQNNPIYPNMMLYEEILLLQGYFKRRWVVENVISWYDPLIKPYTYNKHYYWSNFFIAGVKNTTRGISNDYKTFDISKKLNIDISNYKGINKTLALRNCVEPQDGLHIFNLAMEVDSKLNTEQYSLF